MVESEPKVYASAPMPKGYGFLAKGDPYCTGLCRRLTQDAKKEVYVVVNKRNSPIGIRAPKWILAKVHDQERATRDHRRAAVHKRDLATRSDFEAAILRLFPRIPPQDLAKVLDRALKKRSGRVGRTGKLDIEPKARLAVMAHIRHQHTDYDRLLKYDKMPKPAARKKTLLKLSQVCQEWRGSEPQPKRGGDAARRKTRNGPTQAKDACKSATQILPQAQMSTGDTRIAQLNGKSTEIVPHGGEAERRKKKKRKKRKQNNGGIAKAVSDLKRSEGARQTRSASNLAKVELSGPNELIIISSDESDLDELEDSTGSEEESEEESDDSFIVGDYSDSLMDEDWEEEEDEQDF